MSEGVYVYAWWADCACKWVDAIHLLVVDLGVTQFCGSVNVIPARVLF